MQWTLSSLSATLGEQKFPVLQLSCCQLPNGSSRRSFETVPQHCIKRQKTGEKGINFRSVASESSRAHSQLGPDTKSKAPNTVFLPEFDNNIRQMTFRDCMHWSGPEALYIR